MSTARDLEQTVPWAVNRQKSRGRQMSIKMETATAILTANQQTCSEIKSASHGEPGKESPEICVMVYNKK